MASETASDQPFGSLNRQMNKFMDQMQKGFFSFSPSEVWTPNVNLYETEASYIVCVDLAGVDKEKIDLTVADSTLTLKGARSAPTNPDTITGHPGEAHAPRYRVHLMEIDHGPFSREVELPEDVQKEKISAAYRDGMLWVELPKSGGR